MNNPLVSIVVITYHSEQYVIETLNSIKAQSYSNIELIISDDCSKDQTVSACEKWIASNSNRFVRATLVTSPQNQGIPKNCNQGLAKAKGDWVKLIAGDDTLEHDCIENFLDFVSTDESITFCFSNFNTYRDYITPENLVDPDLENNRRAILFSEMDNEYQLKAIIRHVIIHGPTTFYKRSAFVEHGGYNEAYRFVEDRPAYYDWLLAGNKFHYLQKKTVNYRLNTHSITNKKDEQNSEIRNFSILFRDLIHDLFYPHYSLLEKVFFHIKYRYFKFYKNVLKYNILSKAVRRVWYFFVEMGDKRLYNSLYKYHKEFSSKQRA